MTGSVEIKVRPLRLAYLVDPNDKEQAREAIRLSSTLWGGMYFPIIPLHIRMPGTWREKPFKTPSAKDVILGYLEAFDPDILVQFSQDIPAYVKDLGLTAIKPGEIWKGLDEEKNVSPRYGLGIFELLNDIYEEFFKFKRKYPVKVQIPKLPAQHQLFWASLFGEFPRNVAALIEKHYFEHLEAQAVDFQPADLMEIMKGNVLFPRRITQRGIVANSRSGFRRDAFVYFLDARKVEDIIDFWNLRALGKQVIPLPKQLKEEPSLKVLVTQFLRDHRRPWRHNPAVCDIASIIRGRSCTMDEVQEYAKTLKIDKAPDDPSGTPFFSIQHWYPRVWDAWARDKDAASAADTYGESEESVEIADRKELSVPIKAVLPKFAHEHAYHDAPRCANDIGFRLYGSDEYLAEVFPRSPGVNFAHAISGLWAFTGDWRVGRNGLVRLIKYAFDESRDIPTAESIFFPWLQDLGWKPNLSPPGLLAKQIYRQLGGQLHALGNQRLLGLLEHMNGGRVNRDGSAVEENKIGQERELPIGEVKSRLESARGRGNPYDYLLSKGVFRLGLRIQCAHCLRHSWFSLDSVRDAFTCPKCLSVFPAVGNLDGATWCYKTAGPFSVPNYADGAYAVLLTLGFFDDRKLHTIRTTPLLSFVAEAPNKKSLEADLALFWQESPYGEKSDGIAFGECKSYGQFERKDFDRMRYLAKTFPGAVLVFSTLRTALTRNEIVEIARIAKAGRKYWKPERPINPVLVLTGTELLDHSGPPYCWDDSTKAKFGHVHGLLQICDATQQIYLNLPSWQTEWHEKWEKKRRKRHGAQVPNAPVSVSAPTGPTPTPNPPTLSG